MSTTTKDAAYGRLREGGLRPNARKNLKVAAFMAPILIFALLFVYIIQPQFEKLVAALHRHPKWPARLVAIGGVLLAVDMVSSAHIAVDIGNKLDHFGASWRFW